MSGSSKNLLSVLGAGYTGALLYQNQDLVGEIGKSVLRVRWRCCGASSA